MCHQLKVGLSSTWVYDESTKLATLLVVVLQSVIIV